MKRRTKAQASKVRRQTMEISERGVRIPRVQFTAGFSPEIDQRIKFSARRFKCSERLVVAVGMAAFFGVKIPDSLDGDK